MVSENHKKIPQLSIDLISTLQAIIILNIHAQTHTHILTQYTLF